MVSRLLEQEEAIRVVLGSDRKTSHLIPTWQDIRVWEAISKALSPIADLTDLLSGDTHVTVSSILPVMHNLCHNILAIEEDDTPLTKEIKKGVVDDLQPRYSGTKVQQFLQVATYLDPRFKTDFVNGAEELELLEDDVIDFGMDVIASATTGEPLQATSASASTTILTPTTESHPAKKKKLVAFLKKQPTGEVSQTQSPISLQPLQKLQAEVQAYKLSPKLEIESDVSPLQWWKANETTYPILSQLARKFLCVCTTSSTSERVFSTAGNIFTSTRATMKPHKVNMLTFLARNL